MPGPQLQVEVDDEAIDHDDTGGAPGWIRARGGRRVARVQQILGHPLHAPLDEDAGGDEQQREPAAMTGDERERDSAQSTEHEGLRPVAGARQDMHDPRCPDRQLPLIPKPVVDMPVEAGYGLPLGRHAHEPDDRHQHWHADQDERREGAYWPESLDEAIALVPEPLAGIGDPRAAPPPLAGANAAVGLKRDEGADDDDKTDAKERPEHRRTHRRSPERADSELVASCRISTILLGPGCWACRPS